MHTREPNKDARGPTPAARAGHAPVLALQRKIGNRAVSAMLDHAEPVGRPVQRMQQPPAPAVATAQESLDVTQEDLQIVRDYRASTHDPEVRALLRELISHLVKVTKITQDRGRSGGHTRDLGGHQYEISYSFPDNGDPRDRISVLVHELTHVAVNEAYDSNMLNLPVPALSPEETAAVTSTVPSANHEEALQNARIAKGSPAVRAGYIDMVVRQAGTLLRELPGSGLPPELQERIRDKLANHTTMKPYHEYDAVLAHLLAWSDQYGADKGSAFYTRLTSLVRETVSWRQPGSLGPDVPPPAADSAPAGPVNGPASARREDSRTQERFARLMTKLARR